MSSFSRLSPRLKPSFHQLPQIAKTVSVLAFTAGILSLAGCGGETNDDGSTQSVTANSSLSANPVANAATDAYSNGVVPSNNGSPPVQANGQPYNRAVIQRAGQGD
ncbi:hypothetical protein GCT19_31275 [Paraburkholderia sp. CNPSo 3155]|uniref:hypothetical protein n=1 Tax=Paraburkholderia atlantica TaxID=2654982 RepID=UPI00128CEFA7|nr:hypothetical protein [Paraburkholderia atlantica]MPW10075.1 hypothetical protein [Paraburkholderia atlantica]